MYSRFPVIHIPAVENFIQWAKFLKKIYHFYKVTKM